MAAIIDLPAVYHQQDINMIWDIVLELGPEYRKLIALRYLGDLSLSDIANELGIPLGTVKSRLNTAHHRLRQKLQENN
jgi:RNA polymerase sigma-70 factor (ECF subfamily)